MCKPSVKKRFGMAIILAFQILLGAIIPVIILYLILSGEQKHYQDWLYHKRPWLENQDIERNENAIP